VARPAALCRAREGHHVTLRTDAGRRRHNAEVGIIMVKPMSAQPRPQAHVRNPFAEGRNSRQSGVRAVGPCLHGHHDRHLPARHPADAGRRGRNGGEADLGRVEGPTAEDVRVSGCWRSPQQRCLSRRLEASCLVYMTRGPHRHARLFAIGAAGRLRRPV
jgi:hypothetical protein